MEWRLDLLLAVVFLQLSHQYSAHGGVWLTKAASTAALFASVVSAARAVLSGCAS